MSPTPASAIRQTADVAPAAQPAATPASLENPGPGWLEAGRSRAYVSQDLFNHIDGGAELFLEYGFREVIVRRVRKDQATITHEVYEMKDPTAAWGIYQRFRGKGVPVTGIAGRNVGNRYQIITQKDRFFVQVTAASGDDSCIKAMANLITQTLVAIQEDGEVALLGLLPVEHRVRDSELLVCGPYSLQNIFTFGERDILQLKGERCGIAADYQTQQDGLFTRLVVAYDTSQAAQQALQHLTQGLDPQLTIIRQGEDGLVFRDMDDQFGSVTAINDKLDIRLHLVGEPSSTSRSN